MNNFSRTLYKSIFIRRDAPGAALVRSIRRAFALILAAAALACVSCGTKQNNDNLETNAGHGYNSENPGATAGADNTDGGENATGGEETTGGEDSVMDEYIAEELAYAQNNVIHVDDIVKQDFIPVKVVDRTTLDGKVITGYQGWFGTERDACPERGWLHWSSVTPPSLYGSRKNSLYNVTFNLYPSVDEYSTLYETALPDLGGGGTARLFSSYDYDTIDLHFKWMQEYGIETVALQRFFVSINNPVIQHFNAVLDHVIAAAEKYGRSFYISYDPAGFTYDGFIDLLKRDFNNIKEKLTASPAYQYHDGKPVVQVVEVGNITAFYSRTIDEALEMIDFLKEQGFYVILGTPSYWRADINDAIPGYHDAGVYMAANMISPWMVGRFGRVTEVPHFYENICRPDFLYCAGRGVRYTPSMFAGFDFSMWVNDESKKFNEIPRLAGEFFTVQAKNILELGAQTVYLGMFDEYDESTAIAKAASDSFEVPRAARFVTYSSDGVFVGGDYYLRLAGKFQQIFKEGGTSADMQSAFDGMHKSIGPVLLRTGFEKDMDMIPAKMENANFRLDTFFQAIYEPKVSLSINPQPAQARTNGGSMLLEYKGADDVVNADILVKNVLFNTSANTKMQYFRYTEEADGTGVFIDLIASDGTRLSQTGAVTWTGKPVGKSHSAVGNWSETCVNVGKYFSDKTITQIVLVVPEAEKGKAFTTYFDDLTITDGALGT